VGGGAGLIQRSACCYAATQPTKNTPLTQTGSLQARAFFEPAGIVILKEALFAD
jgi:hypothetical protein